jgi:3-hydroxy-9,10-secoandrosta-1,3,5(10)-triene-9,17-dione monooxygenase
MPAVRPAVTEIALPYGERCYAAGRKLVADMDPVLPKLAELAGEAEALGRMPDTSMAAMIAAGVFRALTPRRWGGLEVDPAAFFEMTMKAASACGSAGWVAGLVSVHSWQIALMDERLQQEFWQDGPDSRASSSYMPVGQVTSAPSGIDHSDWALLGSVVRDNGPAEFRTFAVPKRDFVIDQDSWQVAGLKGTGSKALIVADAFVPDYRTHRLTDVHRGTNPGWATNEGALYRLSWMAIFYSSISAAAVGAASGGLQAFLDDARTRISPNTGAAAADNVFLHLRLANALARVESVRRRLLGNWSELFDALCRGEVPTPHDWARNRFWGADTTSESYRALSEVFETAGGAGIYLDRPLQRFFRDVMAMRNHPTATRERFAQIYVAYEMGLKLAPFDASTMATLAVYG